MIRQATRFATALFLCFCALSAAASAATAAEVRAIRTGENVGLTRVVLDLSDEIEWRLFVLDDPYRVVIDLMGVEWALRGQPDPPRGLVQDLRFGRFKQGIGRLVLDATRPAVAHRVFMLPPQAGQDHRLVIDLRPADAAEFAEVKAATASAIPTPPEAVPEATKVSAAVLPPGVPPVPPPRPGGRDVVVIDPGHGGVDPGAIGAGGTREKDVVLAVGLALEELLQQRGRYRVVMTRDGDSFVSLSDRVQIARHAGAELFVSLHADAAAGRTAHGAGVYTLSETASDKEAAALARRENRADIIAGVNLDEKGDDVASILIDLAQRETMNRSARLAQTVVVELGRYVTMRANPHRFAGFRVLTAPDVPSVLVEIGFLTNEEEEHRLNSARTRHAIAEGLAQAIDGYFAARQARR